MADDPIMRMAKAHWNACRNYPAWDSLTALHQDAHYDAMWTALKELREPTKEMIGVGNESAETCLKDDPCGKAGLHIWSDMIDKLLEVK